MILDYNTWRKNVVKWASDKGLIKKENAYPQFAKVLEETQEILVALNMMDRAISKEEYEEGKKLFVDAIYVIAPTNSCGFLLNAAAANLFTW